MPLEKSHRSTERVRLLMELRACIGASQRCAEKLALDPQKASEAARLLAQLEAIGRELDGMDTRQVRMIAPANDPIWSNPRNLWQ